MSRARYLPAEARVKQVARLVRERPGITLAEVSAGIGVTYFTTAAYVRRAVREGLVAAVVAGPASGRGTPIVLHPARPLERKAA